MTSAAAESRPIPPRFRWLRRFCIVGVTLIIGLAGLRWWWGYIAQRQIDQFIAQVHARGEPILMDDFDVPAIPASQDRQALIDKVVRRFTWTPAESAFGSRFDVYAPPSSADVTFISGMMKTHRVDLQMIRTARAMKDPGRDLRGVQARFWNLNTHRALCSLLNIVALEDHALGNDSDAIEHLRDMGTIGDACMNDTNMVSFMVGVGTFAMQADATRVLANSLAIAKPGAAGSTPAANPKQVRALIAELLDERQMDQFFARDLSGERAFAVANWNRRATADPMPALIKGLLRPMYKFASLRAARTIDLAVKATERDRYPTAVKKLPSDSADTRRSILNDLLMGDRRWYGGPHRPPFEHRFRISLLRRAAAIALAIRLYQADHDGSQPQTLAQLVPNYLPAIPDDPFAPSPRLLQYRLNREPPVVYSVGINGIDDGGTLRNPAGYPYYVDWTAPDYVVALRPPKAAASSAPATTSPAAPKLSTRSFGASSNDADE